MKNNNVYSPKGWKRVLMLIFPYIFIVGFFQFMGAQVAGMDFTNLSTSVSFP